MAVPVPPVDVASRTMTPPPVAAPPRAAAEPSTAPSAAPEPPAALAKPPKVHLSFLAYSPRAERRSVSLTVEGGSLVVLHEGESADGVEVARILPDHVELRSGGRTFAVGTR